MTNTRTRFYLAAAAMLFMAPAIATAASFGAKQSGGPQFGGINCSGPKVCLCKGMTACKKLAANCATKLQGGRAPSGGIYGKCNHVLSVKPLGLATAK